MPATQASEANSPASDDFSTAWYSRCVAFLWQLAATILFFGGGAIVSPACWVVWKCSGGKTPPVKGQELLHSLFRFFINWLRTTRSLVLDDSGMESLRGVKGTIFVANHPSLVDAIFLVGLLPPVACIMRANLLHNPILGGGARLAGYVTNESGAALVRQAAAMIASGGNLLIFPEGTRTSSSQLHPFKHGFALIAVRTNAPVQTLVIDYRGQHLRKGQSLLIPSESPLRFRIRPGELLTAGPQETPRAFTDRVAQWYRDNPPATPSLP